MRLTRTSPGPFHADQLREGDRYELSNGHPIECSPAGRDHASKNLAGGSVLETDPDVEWAGVDAGYSPDPGTLRAPDVAVGAPEGEGQGWLPGAPPLAVEYAGVGQDEGELQDKIGDLFGAGTRVIWVVRLVGPRRVEVYEPGKPVRTFVASEELTAPGILRNPVPVQALFDRKAAHQAVLRNLLQRSGYQDLDHVRREGRDEGRIQEAVSAVLTLLEARGLEIPEPIRRKVTTCRDLDLLRSWLIGATTAETSADVVDG